MPTDVTPPAVACGQRRLISWRPRPVRPNERPVRPNELKIGRPRRASRQAGPSRGTAAEAAVGIRTARRGILRQEVQLAGAGGSFGPELDHVRVVDHGRGRDGLEV